MLALVNKLASSPVNKVIVHTIPMINEMYIAHKMNSLLFNDQLESSFVNNMHHYDIDHHRYDAK